MVLSNWTLAEMKAEAEELVENDFLVAASTFNFLNWFSLPAEVRVYRHKTNWFQILIPLTAEQSRGLSAIDLQSIQTQLMCWRPMGGGGGTPSFLRFHSVLFSPLLSLTDDTHSSSAFGNILLYSHDGWCFAPSIFSPMILLCINHFPALCVS